jgi:hypothetical protein
MQFQIDADQGTSVSGWVVLENPAAIPRISVSSPGNRREIEIEANVLREDLRDLGLHATGMAGFFLDQTSMPGIQDFEDLELREAESRLLIYRRIRSAVHTGKKLFLYSLNAMPQTHVEEHLSQYFAQSYFAVERYNFDTLFSIFNSHFMKSILVSGRPRYFRYEQLLRDKDYQVAALLRDPYEELAERLLFVRFVSSGDSPAFASNYITGIEPLTELVRNLDFEKKNSLKAALSTLTDAQREALANPFVRTLACTLDETPDRKHVAIALEKLSAMTLVGLASHFEEFKSMLSQLIGVHISAQCQLRRVSWVSKVAALLRQIEAVRYLLALDDEMYRLAQAAIKKGLRAA